jgi:hypothetical protein
MRQRQDQLILAWLLSSLGPDILRQAISYETSADLWRMLHSSYSAQSTSRMLELKLSLFYCSLTIISAAKFLMI